MNRPVNAKIVRGTVRHTDGKWEVTGGLVELSTNNQNVTHMRVIDRGSRAVLLEYDGVGAASRAGWTVGDYSISRTGGCGCQGTKVRDERSL
jgi:hypothetical protein